MKTRDQRLVAIGCAIVAILGIGLVIHLIPSRGIDVGSPRAAVRDALPAVGASRAAAPADPARLRAEAKLRFEQAIAMLHAKRFEYALAALDRVLAIVPQMPEAHVNRGFALLGLGAPLRARVSFERAIDLRASQLNAYYGLAVASDELGDRSIALGAMRTFVHLAEPDDPFVRKARAALWEWQSESTARGATQASLASRRVDAGGEPREEATDDEG